MIDSFAKFSIIDNLRKDKDWSANYLCKLAGVSHNTLYTWKRRKSMPTVEVLDAICDVLDFSISQLFSECELEDLTSAQKKLLEDWSALPQNHRKVILDMIKALRNLE